MDSQVDKSLDEWPEDDWRLFVGDLGNEVTEDLLARPFSKVKTKKEYFVLHLPANTSGSQINLPLCEQ